MLENVQKLVECAKTGRMCKNWQMYTKIIKIFSYTEICAKTGRMCKNWQGYTK